MKQELKAKWVAALRSGKYAQGHKLLKRESITAGAPATFCCLGVLREVANGEDTRQSSDGSLLCDAQLEELGLTDGLQDTLWRMNDGRQRGLSSRECSFAEIADWIEQNVAVT